MSKLTRSELANLAVGLPIVTAIIGVCVGAGLGIGIGWVIKPTPAPLYDPATRITLDAFSADQIQFKCGQIQGEELKTANERISALARERDEYERRVLALEKQLAAETKSAGAGARSGGGGVSTARAAELESKMVDLQRELNATRDQLADVTRQLYTAEEEKKQLQEALVATSSKLRVTEQALSVQTEKTEVARRDAMGQKWWRFLADSQLEICEKGSRNKMGACREAVQARISVNAVQDRFGHCVRSEQATPAVRLLGKEDALPRFAQFLDQDDKIVRDWYIQMCDPTLPEAGGFLEGSPSTPSPAPLSQDFTLEDLD